MNNFTNHLFAIGERLCIDNNLPFEILMPLIIETTDKIKSLSPKEVQTGPAKRKDTTIIQEHIAIIKEEEIKELYQKITDNIIKFHE